MTTNLILYGPPGTGKTYHTVNEALRLLDPEFLEKNKSDRTKLKQRFDELSALEQICFVTFHQSFSYEDFVEGIRASSDKATGGLRYDIEDGVFKRMSEAARYPMLSKLVSNIDNKDCKIWKMSLGVANTEKTIYDHCIQNNLALMGFGYKTDLTGVRSRDEILARIKAKTDEEKISSGVSALNRFILQVKKGDLIVVTEGNLNFRAIGMVTGDYIHINNGGHGSYSQARPIHWLKVFAQARHYTELMDKRFSQKTIYQLTESIDRARLEKLLEPDPSQLNKPKGRVLVIDEINRGNVSRIFGELITLIEPSKRLGQNEALEVTLPYSKQRFGVPDNLHIIGTMNTADRSLAGLDVALRRRFKFQEMLPDLQALKDVKVEDIAIDRLLETMNQRIEVLLGRDYMLGHAYFMPLRNTPTMEKLAEIFRNQVLPLLQEYFFEDWQKIAWVLNDHRKTPDEPKFIKQTNVDIDSLLGKKEINLQNTKSPWSVNQDAFDQPKAYLATIPVDSSQGAA